MRSARTSLGEVRTRRRSRRASGPSASAKRAASSQNTGTESATNVRFDGDEMAAAPTTVTPVTLPERTSPLERGRGGLGSPSGRMTEWTII